MMTHAECIPRRSIGSTLALPWEATRASLVRYGGLVAVAVFSCALFAVGVIHAGCPDPVFSHVDPCLVACPAGDSVFLVIVRSHVGSPKAGVQVIVDFSNCPGFILGPPSSGDPYTVDSSGRRISTLSTPSGAAAFPIRGGGSCGEGEATVSMFCSGATIPLGSRVVASFDQNGDLIVDETDEALVQAKVGEQDASADFNCDGIVTSSDVDIVRAHAGHRSSGPSAVPAPIRSGFFLAIHPNPTSGHLTASLALPSAEPGTLDLMDLSGRRLLRWEVDVRAGRQSLSLRLPKDLRPGLYFLCLAQPPRATFARVIMTR